MVDRGKPVTEEDVLAVFDDLEVPSEPLGTDEVAEELGCSRQRACAFLEALADSEVIESKRIDSQARAWWRPATERRETEQYQDVTGHRDGDEMNGLASPGPGDAGRFIGEGLVCVVVFDDSGEVTFANGRAEELLGLDASDGQTYERPDWNVYRNGTPETIDEYVVRTFETGEPDVGVEHAVERPDGTGRWLWGNSAPVRSEDGAVEGVVVGFVDATPLKEREEKLTSDECRLVELASTALCGPFLEAADGPFRIDVDEVVTLQDATALQYVTATGVPTRALMATFEEEFDALDVRLLRSSAERCEVEVHLELPTAASLFEELGGEVISLVRRQNDREPVLVAELPGDVDPRTAVQSLRRAYPDIELRSQQLRYSPRMLSAIAKDELTNRQFAALQTAYCGGYFETPRRSDGDELAARLDITRQTFNQHLRKAEQTLFEQLFEASGERGR